MGRENSRKKKDYEALPSRRFKCERCGSKCRSSNAERGKRRYCRPCELKDNDPLRARESIDAVV